MWYHEMFRCYFLCLSKHIWYWWTSLYCVYINMFLSHVAQGYQDTDAPCVPEFTRHVAVFARTSNTTVPTGLTVVRRVVPPSKFAPNWLTTSNLFIYKRYDWFTFEWRYSPVLVLVLVNTWLYTCFGSSKYVEMYDSADFIFYSFPFTCVYLFVYVYALW